nr:hypothetical protein [uncultured Microbacterium sp.]
MGAIDDVELAETADEIRPLRAGQRHERVAARVLHERVTVSLLSRDDVKVRMRHVLIGRFAVRHHQVRRVHTESRPEGERTTLRAERHLVHLVRSELEQIAGMASRDHEQVSAVDRGAVEQHDDRSPLEDHAGVTVPPEGLAEGTVRGPHTRESNAGPPGAADIHAVRPDA